MIKALCVVLFCGSIAYAGQKSDKPDERQALRDMIARRHQERQGDDQGVPSKAELFAAITALKRFVKTAQDAHKPRRRAQVKKKAIEGAALALAVMREPYPPILTCPDKWRAKLAAQYFELCGVIPKFLQVGVHESLERVSVALAKN